jgi:hypothetical protein
MSKSRNHSERSLYMWKEDKLITKDICFDCGSDEHIHYHHVVPETKGGTMTIPLCIICHGKVHNRDFMKIKELQKVGIEKAKRLGKYKGRTNGSYMNTEKWIQKPKNYEVVKYLKEGYRANKISEMVGVHVNTITKIKKYLSSLEQTNVEPPKPKKKFWERIFNR